MEKLNRRPWAAETRFTAHGVRIAVRANTPEALEGIAPFLPPHRKAARSPVVDRFYSLREGASTRPGVRPFHLVWADGGLLARARDLADVQRSLEADLNFFLAERTPNRVFVHAGVVGWQGRAIVIPGRSRAGKSTLVAALVRAGATYYSDEFALFDAEGRVHPFARPLSLRRGGLYPERCDVGELGGSAGSTPLPVGLVVVSQFREGSRWRPRELSPGRAALALLSCTLPARDRPEAALSTLHHAIAGVPVLKGSRGEADDMIGSLLDRVSHTPSASCPLPRGA